ncbi:MAG: oligosaccharide flippase family protein, partial [Paramuribaculum sp.]|nr:oligosaccharide flippase family protein [Paramuribaculum sp.]
MVVAGDRSLLKRAFTGTAWVAVDRLLTLAVRFVVTLVLAWLLSPADFACVGILAVFVAVSTTLLDSGFGAALIRESDPSQTDYSSVFYWNLSVAVIMCLLLWLIAPAVGSSMSLLYLSSFMRGLSFGLFADALC